MGTFDTNESATVIADMDAIFEKFSSEISSSTSEEVTPTITQQENADDELS